jgi:hypothetical protein
LSTYADELFLDEQTMAIYEKENKWLKWGRG